MSGAAVHPRLRKHSFWRGNQEERTLSDWSFLGPSRKNVPGLPGEKRCQTCAFRGSVRFLSAGTTTYRVVLLPT